MYNASAYNPGPMTTSCNNNAYQNGGKNMYASYGAPNSWNATPAAPVNSVLNLTYLNNESLVSWREVIQSFIPVYDTNFFMFYSVQNCNTLLSAVRDIHLSSRRIGICCEETRLELERLCQNPNPDKRQLAQNGLQWYRRLQQDGILQERPAVMERNGNASSYADAALIDLMLGQRLLGDTSIPYCYVGKDKNLSSDIYQISQLKSCKGIGGKVVVKYLNKYGKPVDYIPNGSQPENHTLQNGAFQAQDAGHRRFGPATDPAWR